jgi:hypothetical protein
MHIASALQIECERQHGYAADAWGLMTLLRMMRSYKVLKMRHQTITEAGQEKAPQ